MLLPEAQHRLNLNKVINFFSWMFTEAIRFSAFPEATAAGVSVVNHQEEWDIFV